MSPVPLFASLTLCGTFVSVAIPVLAQEEYPYLSLGYSASTSRRLDMDGTTSVPFNLEAGLFWLHTYLAVFGEMGSTVATDRMDRRDSILRVGVTPAAQWRSKFWNDWAATLGVAGRFYLFEQTADRRDPSKPLTILGGVGGCLQPYTGVEYGQILLIDIGLLFCDDEVNRSLTHPNFQAVNSEHTTFGGVVRLRWLIPFGIAP